MTRWAVLGTANIAAKSFLPAMRAAGGRAVVVGTRDPQHAGDWALTNDVARTATYEDAIGADDVDAVYVALPNSQHTTWAARAMAAGKAVLCEKPLGVDTADTARLLDATPDGALLWESFVFPFHPQTDLLRTELQNLGQVYEIHSEFRFTMADPDNIRWQAGLHGGALLDVGCYCVRLARLLFDADATGATAAASYVGGVDADIAAILEFPGERRLLLSAGMRGMPSTFTRILGTDGELRVTNPFHPRPGNTVQRRHAGGDVITEWTAGETLAFQYGVEHVQAVLRGETAPRHLAATDALGNSAALDLIAAAAQPAG